MNFRLFFFGFVAFLPLSGNSYWVDYQGAIHEQVIHLKATERMVQYRLAWELTPDQSLVEQTLLWPLPQTARNLRGKINNQDFRWEILTDTNARAALFAAAKKDREPKLFAWADPLSPQLLRADFPSIEKNTTVELTWEQPIDFYNDFFISWSWASFQPADRLEVGFKSIVEGIKFSGNTPLELPESGFVQADLAQWWYRGEWWTAPQPIFWFYSLVDSPVVPYDTDHQRYQVAPVEEARFIPQSIDLVVDRSGSMLESFWPSFRSVLRDLSRGWNPKMKFSLWWWDENLHPWREAQQVSIVDLEPETIKKISLLPPFGDSTLQAWEGWKSSAQAVLLITDQPEPPEWTGVPVIVLHVSPIKSKTWEFWAEKSGGWYQQYLPYAEEWNLVEDFWHTWQHWSVAQSWLDERWSPSEAPLGVHFQNRWRGQLSALPEAGSAAQSPAFRWVPAWWWTQKAQSFDQQNRARPPWLMTAWQALGGGVDRSELPIGNVGYRYWPTISGVVIDPQFSAENTDANWELKLAPWSTALEDLFIRVGDRIGSLLSLGTQVEGCAEFRCFSIRWGHREVPQQKDRLRWRGGVISHPAEEPWLRLAQAEILSLPADGSLPVQEPILRGRFLMAVDKLYQGVSSPAEPETAAANYFSDISSDQYFFSAVQKHATTGRIEGYADGTFKPLNPITRAEAIKWLLALDGFVPLEIGENPFVDVVDWQIPWIAEAFDRGWIQGYPDATFRPNQPLTLGEAALLLDKVRQAKAL